ncbi:type I-E CRISPR-associated protein Cas7/Cse4/CasC [Salinicola sp. JS01]|uniref:type I-E CRISPR-associated protein Cas7/Cse4/CasC n=1 Tax=Salinicola sp. JS01 TaxID=3050071 RepID=UPI00255B60C5|nr:type I-E CRISPR-associated protein Cas7/Cse4/CasC [Salinicola sp. JS01]WIX32286.1 type I-E CRISPR-associated protein Cas7/Cse4/CasC [Salinicola sp. JS01]
MSHFIQLHLLTAYPPSNLNRDDLGRPKTAFMGGARRLRVSSQSLKRNWRTSDLFESAVDGHKGTRTKRLGKQMYDRMKKAGANDKTAENCVKQIVALFGKASGKGENHEYETEQLVHIGPEELTALEKLVDVLGSENRLPNEKEIIEVLARRPSAVDIALFGRMLTGDKNKISKYSVEAACQVAHAITVHAAEVEDDYFTAVDDLNTGDEDRGAAHIGEAGFAAGLFYLYLCIDRDLLIENLQGNSALADRAIAALVESAVKISPKGKQNSFGSRAHASYLLAEKGDQQPRSLSAAFLQPVNGEGQAVKAIEKLERQAQAFDDAYGPGADRRFVLSATPEYEKPALEGDVTQGNLQALQAFLQGDD